MTELLQPAPLPIRGDGRFRAILDRADGIHGVAQYHWPARPAATIVEHDPPSLMALLPKPPALPALSPDTARTAFAMGGGFAASVALVMASGMLKPAQAPVALQDMRPLAAEHASAAPALGRASAFAVPTMLPMLDTTATLVAELPKPAATFQRTLAVRSVAVARIPIADEPESPAMSEPAIGIPATSIAAAEPEFRQAAPTQPEQPVQRRRLRAKRLPEQRQEASAPQSAASAPQSPARREPWPYDHMRSALGLSLDKR